MLNSSSSAAAAVGGAEDAVAFLLYNGASPDLIDNYHRTALQNSQCVSTALLLAPVRKRISLGRALAFLDAHPTEVTTGVRPLLSKIF